MKKKIIAEMPKLCPNCGARAEVDDVCIDGFPEVDCKVECPMCGKLVYGDSRHSAIELWNSQTAEQILLCPFCGGKAEVKMLIPESKENPPIFSVRCLDCGAEIIRGGSEKNAIRAWNNRLNWTCRVPDKNRFIGFLEETRKMLQAMEVNSDETGQIIDDFLEGMGVEKNEKD